MGFLKALMICRRTDVSIMFQRVPLRTAKGQGEFGKMRPVGPRAENFQEPPNQETPYVMFAVVLPAQESGFRAGFRPDSNRESFNFDLDFEAFQSRIRLNSGPETRSPARKHYRIK